VITVADAPPAGTKVALRNAAPLLLGVGFLMAGSGLTSTLLGIRAGLEGFRPSVTGIVLAGYYLGFVVGSLVAPSTIARVGHVRVFAGLASLASGAVLIHVIQPEPISWFVLRAVSGMCISALYVVCETWLNGAATNRSRGTLLGVYMVVVSAALLVGQLLFSLADPAGFASFVLASVLVSLAVVPVSLASFAAPVVPDTVPLSLRGLVRAAPLAPVGALLSGFIGSAMLGGGVVYASEAGLDRLATGSFIGAALLGGVVLQVPLGRWSDRSDRRLVILLASLTAAAVAVAVAVVGPSHRLVVIGLTTVAGGSTFPLYSLANAHLNDYLESSLLVAGGARMVLVNGVGAIGGPIVGAAAVGSVGPGSLFVVMAAAYVAMGAFALLRMMMRAPVADEDRTPFVPVAVGVGPTVPAFEADPDELYPPTAGSLVLDDETIEYREQGEGTPVVLVGELPGRQDTWVEVLPALAFDGLRAVTAWSSDVDGGDDLDADDVLELLRHLDLPSASFVGAGPGVDVVDRLVEEHADRIDAVVLLRPPGPTDDLTGELELVPARPTMLVDPARWEGDVEELADDITEFVRLL
jgi:MFS family permease